MALRWLNRALCSGHDYSSWQGVGADPAYRQHMSGVFGRSDWRTYAFPCHEFRKCGNCGDVQVQVVHYWSSPQTRSGRSYSSVDDNTGHGVTWREQYCMRSDCDATQRCA